jgi:hypothetical protein
MSELDGLSTVLSRIAADVGKELKAYELDAIVIIVAKRTVGDGFVATGGVAANQEFDRTAINEIILGALVTDKLPYPEASCD